MRKHRAGGDIAPCYGPLFWAVTPDHQQGGKISDAAASGGRLWNNLPYLVWQIRLKAEYFRKAGKLFRFVIVIEEREREWQVYRNFRKKQ